MIFSKDQVYITEARRHAKNILDAVYWFRGQGQTIWNAEDYGNALPDGEGLNEGITSAEVGAVVFAVADALNTTLDANGGGLKGNLAKLN